MAEREVIPSIRNIKDLDRQTGTKTPIEGKEVSGASANPFPIIISEWDRNAREIVRVALDQFNGRHTVNVRVWYRDGDSVKPSKTGITLSIKHLPQLATALSLALTVAREAGLVDGEGEQ